MSEALTQRALQSALQDAEFGVLVLQDDRIQWINDWLYQFVPVNRDELTSVSLSRDDALGRMLLGEEHQFALPRSGNESIWLRRESFECEGCSVHFFHNITDLVVVGTEVRRLREDLFDLNPKHPVTNLLSRDAIIQHLETQVSRSRRYHNALALLRVRYDFSDLSHDESAIHGLMKQIAFFLNDQMRWADQIGMLDDDTYLIILPETNFEAATQLLKKFSSDTHIDLLHGIATTRQPFSVGLTEWQKGDDAKKMLQRIQQDLDLNLVL